MFHYYHEPWGPWWEMIRPHLELKKIEPDKYIATYSYSDADLQKFRYAHLADITRLQVLIEYGGVYADMDTLFVEPIPEKLFHRSFVMGREKLGSTPAAKQAGGSLCNAFMMGEIGAPFARLWFTRIYDNFDGSWNGHSTLLPYILSKEHPELIHIEPERSFFSYDWTRRGIRTLFQKPVQSIAGIYSIHLWCHLWWDAGRTDFSYFHSGRITPEYIRFSSSAYAVLARNFLPPEAGNSWFSYEVQRFKALLENGRIVLQRILRKAAEAGF
jgi:hypothetical protein